MNLLQIVLCAASAVLLVLANYVFFISPRLHRPELINGFIGGEFAHRGLHDISKGVPENTLLAFEKAAEHGYGMEFDVRFTKDKHLVIMHDNDLERMTGVKGKVSEMTLAELSDIRIGGTDQPVPRFEQVLELIGGRVPLIIELKVCENDYAELADKVCRILDDYSGAYVIESFDPRLIHWLRRNRPDVVRGQLLEFYRRHGNKDIPAVLDFAIHNQLVNVWVRPDFIATNYEDRGAFAMRLSRRLFHTPEFDWTIPDQSEADRSRLVNAGYIFEGFIPESHD